MLIVHDILIYLICKSQFGFIISFIRLDIWVKGPQIRGGILEAAETGQKVIIADDSGVNVLALSMYEII